MTLQQILEKHGLAELPNDEVRSIGLAMLEYARLKHNEAIEAQRQELVKMFGKAGGTLSSYYTMKELPKPEFKP